MAIEGRPGLRDFLAGAAPAVILSSTLSLLPELLKLTSKFQGLLVRTDVQRYSITKYFFFLAFNVVLLREQQRGGSGGSLEPPRPLS